MYSSVERVDTPAARRCCHCCVILQIPGVSDKDWLGDRICRTYRWGRKNATNIPYPLYPRRVNKEAAPSPRRRPDQVSQLKMRLKLSHGKQETREISVESPPTHPPTRSTFSAIYLTIDYFLVRTLDWYQV